MPLALARMGCLRAFAMLNQGACAAVLLYAYLPSAKPLLILTCQGDLT